MTDFTEPLVVSTIRQFKAALLAREETQIRRMADRWLIVERSLRAEMELAARDLADERAAGRSVSAWKLARMERYQDLQRQLEEQMAMYNAYAEAEIMTRQNEYGQLGIDHATQAITASYVGAGAVVATFNRLPVDAIQAMVGLLGDGSPLMTLLNDAYGDAAQAMTTALLRGTALGWNPRQTAQAMADGVATGLGRILTTARTEQLRAYREANRMQFEESGVVEGFVRLVAHQSRTCLACLAAEGEWFPVAESLYDHPNGRCVAPGTLVSGASVEALVSRHYQGDLVTIRTAAGKFLAVTPNHPVLTGHGWVAADALRVGDNVVGDAGIERAARAVAPNGYQVPTLVEDVSAALGMLRLGSVPCAAENFHGDGRGSNVYVVWANGLLGNDLDAALAQPFTKHLFGWRDALLTLFSSGGDFAAMDKGMLAPASDFLGNGNAPMVLLDGGLLGQQAISLGLAARRNAAALKAQAQRRSAHAILGGQRILGFAGVVPGYDFAHGELDLGALSGARFLMNKGVSFGFGAAQAALLKNGEQAVRAQSGDPINDALGALSGHVCADRIVEIGSRTHIGHVYNLQTAGAWYNANGIIIHNCSAVPKVAGVRLPGFQRGADWFRSLPTPTQTEMISQQVGKEAARAWLDGVVDFDQFFTRTPNRTWGPSLNPTSQAEILAGGGQRARIYEGLAA